MAIEIHDLGVTFDNRRALHTATTHFEASSFTVLLGPSGAGKSTLLRCLNGLVQPTTGHVAVDGRRLASRGEALRRHRAATGMIFQQHHLIGRLSVLDNALMGRLAMHGSLRTMLGIPSADRAIALQCLSRVGLLERALDRVDQLSGGQQQRVGIARALTQQPTLILADEPVASLDPKTAADVLALIHAICKADNLTAIVSLHQLELAQRFADRIIGLSGGAIVFDRPPAAFDEAAQRAVYQSAIPIASSPIGARTLTAAA